MSSLQTQFDPARFELLLRASFLQGADARENFRVWNAQIDWNEHLYFDEYRLLPQLYRNLSAQNLQEPLLQKFKGIARKSWYNNHLLLHQVVAPLDALRAAGIDFLGIHGAPFLLTGNVEYVLGAASAFGILVHERDARAAMEQLQKLGWMPQLSISKKILEGYIAARYFHAFVNESGQRIVLQWQLFPLREEAMEEIWAHTHTAQIENLEIQIPNVIDQLLLCCVNGALPRGASVFQRALEARLWLEGMDAQIDWSQFLARAKAFEVVSSLREILARLEFDAGVPRQVLDALPSASARRELATQSAWARFTALWSLHRQRRDDPNLFRNLARFPKFLQHWWRLEQVTDLPRYLVNMAVWQLRRKE